MQSPGQALIATKLSPPESPSGFVMRSRLADQLDAAIDDRSSLVLVSAPAGSGKSTLLAGWLADVSHDVAWVQIDELDADPARFWAYVSGSLGAHVPDVADEVRSALAAGPDAAVAVIVNALAAVDKQLVVVLDDYHLVDNPDVHRSVERLVELRPPNVTVVIATRVDPPFRLGRLRVRDQLTEIRAADLRFDTDEAASLLGKQALDRDAVDRLCTRTEGWAAGLVLAGLSLRMTDDADRFVESFNGDDQLIAEYLGDELLDALDTDDRKRLLDVSTLDKMSGPLVDAVIGTDDGTEWLRATAADNQLVISLDRTGTWYRFHHLLRDLLRLEAQRSSPERVRVAHLAAAEWHRGHDDLEQAIEHFLDADELVAAADLVADNATELLNRGLVYSVNRYIERLGDVAETHGGLAIVRGWVSFVQGRFVEAERWLAIARRLDVDGVDAGLIAALSMMIHIAEGDVTSALAIVEQSPPPTQPTHAMVLSGVRVWAGRYDDARRHSAVAADMAASRPDHFVASVNPVFDAVGEIECGNDAAAKALAEAAISYAADHRLAEAPQLALAHSIIARTSSEGDTARVAAMRGVELARRSPEHLMLSYALASAGDVLCAQGSADGPTLLAEARTIIDRCPDPGIAGRYLARAEARHGQSRTPTKSGALVEDLTDREMAVLRYLPTAMSQREIAGELFVSLNTVKTHCKAIYRKLGVDGRKAAVQTARDLSLL